MTYDVDERTGSELVSLGGEMVHASDARTIGPREVSASQERLTGGISVVPPDRSDDRPSNPDKPRSKSRK